MNVRTVLEQLYQDYENRNIEAALAALPDDFCFEWPLDPRGLRFAGVCNGKAEFLQKLMELDQCFEFRRYQMTSLVVDGDRAAAELEVELVSRHSGETLPMRAAHMWTFRHGTPARLVEYLDSALLAQHVAAAGEK